MHTHAAPFPDHRTLADHMLRDILRFSHLGSGLRLRLYQRQVVRAVASSVLHGAGRTFVVIFPRQSGKNELQAQLQAYLLTLFSGMDAELVQVSPTWKPQSLNAMRRLERVLSRNLLTCSAGWFKEQGYIYRLGRARIYFLSGSPTTNIVGATASALLSVDEAQELLVDKYDKEINPMAASTNATRVFWGTAWTADTLLARELRLAQQAERLDGVPRVFRVDADQVRQEVPAYGKFVDGELLKLGRMHPFVRTQFYCEELDAEGGMFPPERQALMRGTHPAWEAPATPGAMPLFAFLIDVAGQDEHAGASLDGLANPGRDATALTIVQVDPSTLADELIQAPRYLVRARRLWVGERHTALYAQIKALAELWEPRYIVIDATGVGAGLASFLERLAPARLIPFSFSAASKSRLGWDFLAVIETGRFKDHANLTDYHQPQAYSSGENARCQRLFWGQVDACQMEILPGPGKLMRWGVPDGRRDPASGELIHDDLLISAAMCALLDELPFGQAESAVIAPQDPLSGAGEVF